MEIKEILISGGSALAALLTAVQIAPIKINPWTWLADSLGRFINRSLLNSIDDLDQKLDKLTELISETESQIMKMESQIESIEDNLKDVTIRVKDLDDKVKENDRKCDERNIIQCRSRMLRFGDEILHGKNHSKDHFDQILLDCTEYENYCRANPNFLNNITAQTEHLIKTTYEKCMMDNSFL